MHQNIAHESFLHTIIKQTHFYKHYHQLIMLQQLLEDIFKKWSCSLPSQETISDPSKSEEDKTEVTGQEVVNPEDYIKHPLQNRLSFLLPIYQSTNTAKFEPKGSSDDLVHSPPPTALKGKALPCPFAKLLSLCVGLQNSFSHNEYSNSPCFLNHDDVKFIFRWQVCLALFVFDRWSLWFFKNDKSKTWQANLRLISKFDTVEDFWA